MHLSTLLASALTILSTTSSALPLSKRQYYGPSSTKSFPDPFNILIRPTDLGVKDVYLEPLYLSQITGKPKALAMHGSSSDPATFTLKKGTLSTAFEPSDSPSATSWSNQTPEEGHFLTFMPAKSSPQTRSEDDKESSESSKSDDPVIRISRPGSALVLMSVDDDVYAFYFCTSKDGKTQYGLSVGKRPGKNVKCVNVYAEVVPVDDA